MASSSSSSSSLYPYPSTLNPSSFVSMKLSSSKDYPLWKTQMLCLLESQELAGFIDGSIRAPPEVGEAEGDGITAVVVNEEYRVWKRSDRLVKGWILGSLPREVLATVVDCSTAMDVWTKVLSSFGSNLQGMSTPTTEEESASSMYLPLYKAALVGDWNTAEIFLDRDKEAETAIITVNRETLLHVAVATGKAIDFVEKLVERLPREALAIKKSLDETTLSVAAMVGNTKAAKILVEKNPSLLYISNNLGNTPLHIAAGMGHWNTFSYLQSVSSDDDYAGQNGVDLLSRAIGGGQFDIALDLIKRYPHVARLEPTQKCSPPLSVIAGMSSSFKSGSRLNYLQRCIYYCIPEKFDNYLDGPNGGSVDIEDPTINSTAQTDMRVHSQGVCQRLHLMLWNVLLYVTQRPVFRLPTTRNVLLYVRQTLHLMPGNAFVSFQELFVSEFSPHPTIKDLVQKKLVHRQAVQLVKCLCDGIKSTKDYEGYINRTYEPIIKASSLDIVEVVEEIVDIFPLAFWSHDDERHFIIQLAVINRSEKVYNLIYQMNGYQHYITRLTDNLGNNILHLAGQLAPPHKLHLVSSAALQLQRELQWFKEVEKLNPAWLKMVNNFGETPAMVFTREHKELVIEGEKWIKDTANSCTIASSLIITIVFAAAITVPGGNQEETGLPIFNIKEPAFLLFAVSDALALFTSSASLLTFLSVLTARYNEQDFLHALPERLILGLIFLFISITSMIIAFSTSVYLVFGERRGWVFIPLAWLSGFPISACMDLQFPLLISTCGRGIFGKQSDRPFH